MYKCKSCKQIFEEPWETYDRATGCYESGCTHCGHDDYEEVYRCVKCGEYASECAGELCPDCKSEVFQTLSDIRITLMGYGMSEYDAVSVIAEYAEAC